MRSDRQPIDDDTALRPANYLNSIRVEAGNPTLEAIARSAGCAKSSVSQILNGAKIPSNELGDQILRALGNEPDHEWHEMLAAARRAVAEARKSARPGADLAGHPGSEPVQVAPRRRWWMVAAAVLLIGIVAVIAWNFRTVGEAGAAGKAPASPTCRWKVKWPSAGIYDNPTRTGDPLRSERNGTVMGPYCETRYNAAEDETYVKVSTEAATDGVGWMRLNALKAN
jgi:transcriptional regulator with XRE-family HTH domain